VISKDNLESNFKKSFKYWGLECIFSILANISELCVLKERDMGETNEERINELAIDIIKNIFDAMIAYSTLKQGGLNPKNIGLLGTVTSLIGVYQLWK
jgi:fructose-specific phosphotransferase system IIC component